MLSKAGTPYTTTNFTQICRGIDGGNADFRSDFGNGRRELSIKIPRQAVNEEQLKHANTLTEDFCFFMAGIF